MVVWHMGVDPNQLGIGALFDAVADAVVAADVEKGQIVLWNPAAARLFGYSLPEALALPLEALIPEGVRAQHLAGIEYYLSTGHGAIIDGRLPVEVVALHKDGSEIDIELTLSPVTQPDLEGHDVVAIIRDIRERKRLEAERADNARLEGALLAVRTMQHELNNQLLLTAGYAELISQDPALPERLRALAEHALHGATEAAAILARLDQLTEIRELNWGPRLEPTIDLDPAAELGGESTPPPGG
jgi:PAS domain S-box-containing protein